MPPEELTAQLQHRRQSRHWFLRRRPPLERTQGQPRPFFTSNVQCSRQDTGHRKAEKACRCNLCATFRAAIAVDLHNFQIGAKTSIRNMDASSAAASSSEATMMESTSEGSGRSFQEARVLSIYDRK